MQFNGNIASAQKLAAAIVLCVFGSLTIPLGARADGSVAKLWVDQAFQAVRTGNPALHTGTPGAARLYAMVTVATYDAVNGIDRAAGASQLEPWLLPRLFALLSIAVADAVTTSWSDKYGFHYWRPGDAIRQADVDGNSATEQDASWNARGGAPCALDAPLSTCSGFGGTPEHTSGTATFAGATSTVLEGFYCRNDIDFAFVGEQPGATSRSYTSFRRAAAEAGRSRVYGGIHFQFSIEKGYEAGKDLAREILRSRLTPEEVKCGGNTCACLPR